MRPYRLFLFALVGGAALAACAGPTGTTADSRPINTTPYVPEDGPQYGPGDYCADTYVIVQPETRANFSLGSENYRNGDYCAAYPYLQWLLENDPLFTGEDPDDRTFLRMAAVYEDFAAHVDSTDPGGRRAYLDSALTVRAAGEAAMDEAGIAYDPFLRDLREGFFYYQNGDLYENSEELQFEAFRRAFEAQPDSVDDWYLSQLFNGSAAEFGNEVPNASRADFVANLAGAADGTDLQSFFNEYETFLRTEPQGTVGVGDDAAVEALVADLAAGTISDEDALSLLAVIIQQPERLEALGEDVTELRSQVLRLPAVTNQVDNPRTLVALAFQAFRDGDSARGNDLFDRAIENAESNAQRADFYYARANAGYGNVSQLINQALRAYPAHGPSLYRRAGLMAQSVGTQRSLRGRFAYWCLADEYRNVAARTTDSRIASLARTAAARYERAAPTREQYFLEGFEPGQTVSASLGAYGSCSTRVR